MSRLVSELEAILNELIAENQKLLKHLLLQQAAMKQFDVKAMESVARYQEASRSRLVGLENKRRAIVTQLSRAQNAAHDLTIAEIAALFPTRTASLLQQRSTLKAVIQQVAGRVQIAGKLAGAVLSQLNMVVRILAGVMERAGLYTKHGVPQVAARIGVMEAVA